MDHKDKPLYHDQPIPKSFNIELNKSGQPKRNIALNIGNCAIALFRHRPDLDYLAINEGEEWTFIFDKHPLIYWMGGVALGKESKRMLHLMERNNGTFYDRCHFNPDVVVEDYPSQNELDVYVEYEIDRDLHADLRDALKEGFDD